MSNKNKSITMTNDNENIKMSNDNNIKDICATETPECASESTVFSRWGVKDYARKTCCKNHKLMKSMLLSVIDFFKKESINGWYIASGSLLGIVRHNGTQVPWTDDVDLQIFVGKGFSLTRQNYIEKFLRYNTYDYPFSLEKCFQPPRQICTTAFKVHPGPVVGSNDLFSLGPVLLDITPVIDTKDGRIRIWSGYAPWRKFKMLKSNVLPLRKCPHGGVYGVETICPNKPNAFLADIYGSDFMSNGVNNNNFWNVKAKKAKNFR